MADKGGLQLLPENRKSIIIKIPGENRLISIGVALVILVLAVGGGLWMYDAGLTTQITDADTKIADLEKSRNKTVEQNLLTLSKQIGITKQVMNKHVFWSTGLSKIESVLQNNVQFKSFSAVLSEGSFHIRALSDSYTTIAKQLAAFVANDGIKDVTLDGVSTLTNGKLDFNSKIDFIAGIFLKGK